MEITGKNKEDYINHLNGCLQLNTLKNVLTKKTTLRKEVEDFYDRHSFISGGRYGDGNTYFKFEEEDLSKHNKKPSDLIKIVSPFTNDIIDESQLDYNIVREDDKIRTIYNDYENIKVPFWVINGLGILTSVLMPSIGIPFTLATGGMFIYKFKKLKKEKLKYPKIKIDQPSSFENLWYASKTSDDFIAKEYLPEFVRSKL